MSIPTIILFGRGARRGHARRAAKQALERALGLAA